MDFDVAAYLKRIGHDAATATDRATLDVFHARHLDRVPFENIDVFLGRPGSLELDSLQEKIVTRGRGGYCFEQNTLFAAALRAMGFDVRTLEARVRPPYATRPLPRTHMVLRVDLGGTSFLADVGFGGNGPLLPVPLDGTEREQPEGRYRVDREGPSIHVLRHARDDDWRDLYSFTLTPAEPVDYEVAHHYTSTHPRSPFVQTLTVQRCNERARHVLRSRLYTERRGNDETSREIGAAELGPLLADVFDLRLGDDVLREICERFATLPPL